MNFHDVVREMRLTREQLEIIINPSKLIHYLVDLRHKNDD